MQQREAYRLQDSANVSLHNISLLNRNLINRKVTITVYRA